MPAERSDTKLTGSAGEHWVAAVLASRGWAVALTRDGVSRSDVLAVDSRPGGERLMIEVQVKTSRRTNHTSWLLGEKAQSPSLSEREWFALVELPPLGAVGSPAAPRTFIVPRDHLSAAAYAVHMAWLHDATATRARNTSVDRARVTAAQAWFGYEDQWGLLDQPASAAPVLLPPDLRAVIEREGLPEGHPWVAALPRW